MPSSFIRYRPGESSQSSGMSFSDGYGLIAADASQDDGKVGEYVLVLPNEDESDPFWLARIQRVGE